MIVGSSAGGGYDIYARLLARHMPRHIPGNPGDGGEQHDGRGKQRRGRARLQRGSEGRHGDRRAAEQRRPRLAARRAARRHQAAAPRRHQVRPSRLRDHRPLRVHRARRRGGEVLQGPAHPGADHRRQPARHLDARFSGDAQQHDRHQVSPGQRLSRHPRDHARHREERGEGAVRLQLVEPAGATSGLDQVRLHPRAGPGARQGSSGHQQDGRAARRRFRQDAGESPGDGIDLQLGNVRPPVYDVARRAGGAGRGAAEGVHGQRCATRSCWRRRRRIGLVIDPISGEELQALAEKIFATPAAVVEQAKQALEYRAP